MLAKHTKVASFRTAISVSAMLLLSQCASVGTFTTAKLMKPGTFQFGTELGLQVDAGNEKLRAYPSLSVANRFGISEHVELGARAGTGGFELLTKFGLMDEPHLRLSLAPSGGGVVLAGSSGVLPGLLVAQLPLLIGIPLGEHEFTLSPKIHERYFGARHHILAVGTGVGGTIKVGSSFRLNPELTFLMPVVGIPPSGDVSYCDPPWCRQPAILLQFGLGLQWGGD